MNRHFMALVKIANLRSIEEDTLAPGEVALDCWLALALQRTRVDVEGRLQPPFVESRHDAAIKSLVVIEAGGHSDALAFRKPGYLDAIRRIHGER